MLNDVRHFSHLKTLSKGSLSVSLHIHLGPHNWAKHKLHGCSLSSFLKHKVITSIGHTKGWLGKEENKILVKPIQSVFLYLLKFYWVRAAGDWRGERGCKAGWKKWMILQLAALSTTESLWMILSEDLIFKKELPDQNYTIQPPSQLWDVALQGFPCCGQSEECHSQACPTESSSIISRVPFFPLCQVDVSNRSNWDTCRWLDRASIPGGHLGDSRLCQENCCS